MKDLALVYLNHSNAGQESFDRFMYAYRHHAAGVDHDLIVVPKTSKDCGVDLHTYHLTVREHKNPWFCFLNSYSEPLSNNWLAKLFTMSQVAGVGIVGATGSFENLSIASKLFTHTPNPHIRTNAFILSRNLMLSIWPTKVTTKRAAYRVENGNNNITKQIVGFGFKALVVGKDGVGYEQKLWPTSGTFRQGNQENLLVADNQTRRYTDATSQERNFLSQRAWGKNAN